MAMPQSGTAQEPSSEAMEWIERLVSIDTTSRGTNLPIIDLLAEVLQRHGGSISAEHGIGLVKKPWLESTRSVEEVAVMRGIRQVLDPDGIMNPGKLFDNASGS